MVQGATRAERKPVKGKRRAYGAIVVLTVAALAVLAFVLTREHPLTERAAHITPISDYCWINDQELLRIDPGATPLSRINLQTHAQTYLTSFNEKAQLKKISAMDDASVSPNGTRLILLERSQGSAYYDDVPHTCIVDLDGKHIRVFGSMGAWVRERGVPVWMPDSRRWLEFFVGDTQRPFSGEGNPPALWLYSLDAPDRKVGPLPIPKGTMSLLGVTPDYRMIASNLPPGVDQPMLILFQEGLYPNTLAEQHAAQNAPSGWFFRSASLSPKGDRVASLLTTVRQSALLAFFAKIAPSLVKVGIPSRIFQIRICNSDGTHIHEVGFQDTGPDGSAALTRLQWTPDGKHLSFVLKDSLYIVPVE